MANDNKYQYNKNNNKKNDEPEKLPEGYLPVKYFNDDEKLKLKKEYIVDYPKKIADSLGKASEKEDKKDANKRTQIRKFYEYVLRVEQKMKMKDGDFSFVEADLARLLPYATYSLERKVVTKIFVDFIENNLKEIKDQQDLRAFVKHFEAIVAYTKKN